MTVFCVIFLCSCNGSTDNETTSDGGDNTEATTEIIEITTVESLTVEEYEPARAIIITFSHNDPIAAAAQYIEEKTESIVHKIETLTGYPENEEELIKKAAQEHRDNVRPVLKNTPSSLWDYDIVFLCFPIWDNTMPMALFTFVEDYDLRNKAVIPVVYGEKEGLDNAVKDMALISPALMIVNGYSFTSDFSQEQESFDSWLQTILYG